MAGEVSRKEFYVLVSPGIFNPHTFLLGPYRRRWVALVRAWLYVTFTNQHGAVRVCQKE